MNVLIKREQSERAYFAEREKGGMKFKFKFKIQQYQTDAMEPIREKHSKDTVRQIL